jgi:MipA family protein
MIVRLLQCIALLAAVSALAPATHAQSAPDATRPVPEEKNWRLGVGVGYGQRTNPLVQSEDIPVLVDVDIAWFGKRWFFDNGDLGFELLDHPRFTLNTVARVNSDRVFFSKTNTKYVTLSYLGGGAQGLVTNPDTGAPVADPVRFEPPKRDYAIELGLETLLDGEWGQAGVRAFHDVSGTHRGYEIAADYSYRVTRGRLSIAPVLGVSYKSAELSNYYWGVHPSEASFIVREYEARGGLGWEAGLRASYYLTKNIRIAASANYERLQHSVAMSPIVARSYVFGYFAGMAWQF